MEDNRFYFRQLLSGRDFAVGNDFATQMVNFSYAIGDRSTGSCVLVDPAWNVNDLVDIVEADGMSVEGILATHYHADHVGGSIMGHDIEGVATLLERVDCPIHVQSAEVPWMERTANVTADQLVAHAPGDVLSVGDVDITLVHTPGHTPGSQCFLVDGRLVAGDTLFLDGCGRTDLPGSDAAAMMESLRMLSTVPDDVILYPGHRYSLASSATMGSVKQSNFVFQH
ncbi:MAG: MBL fold metallo-hydrolase [Ilumatobacteraceae bacterium]|nr:MBL fold metallo-hydrolase [Actinomycetota bacterium]